MYSYEDRIRAVELCIKLGERLRATIRHLRYPTKNAPTGWYQGNCASGACTIARSGHAAAKAHMYFRLRGDSPCMSG